MNIIRAELPFPCILYQFCNIVDGHAKACQFVSIFLQLFLNEYCIHELTYQWCSQVDSLEADESVFGFCSYFLSNLLWNPCFNDKGFCNLVTMKLLDRQPRSSDEEFSPFDINILIHVPREGHNH